MSRASAGIQFGFAGAGMITGFIASATEQLLRPNAGQLAVDSFVDMFNTSLIRKFPLAGPAINETAETIKSSTPTNNAAEKLNNAVGANK